MKFSKEVQGNVLRTPVWWTQALEQAILDTEGTNETIVLKVEKKDIKSMGAKVREYIRRKFHKTIIIRIKEGFLRVWVPTEMELKDARSEKKKYYTKQGEI